MNESSKKGFISKWLKMIESTMSAAAFAEANAPELAKEMLNTEGVQTESVLFVVQDGEVNDRALNYVTELCHRMACGLAVLCVHSAPTEQFHFKMKLMLDKINVTPTNLQLLPGPLPDAVQQFLRENRRILSVVMNDHFPEQLQAPYRKNPKQRPWWQKLKCPVVFIPAAKT